MRIKNIKIVYLLLIIFFLFNVLNTVLMAQSLEQGKRKAVIHISGKQINYPAASCRVSLRASLFCGMTPRSKTAGYSDRKIKQSDYDKYTVYVKVSPADLIGVTIHISGEHYSDYKPGTDVTFYDVPEGDYSFRAVYGSMETSESGKYIGEDDTVYLKF